MLLAVVDANYCFTYAQVGCQGRISDGGVFKNTKLYKELIHNKLNLPDADALQKRNLPVPYVFVADDAFPLTENIMKPYSTDIEKGSPRRIFNYRLSRARRIVENAFGIMASVFRVFRKPLEVKVDTAANVVLCCVYLHNFLRRQHSSSILYTPPGSFDVEDTDTGSIVDGIWRSEIKNYTAIQPLTTVPRKPAQSAQEIRNEFKEYFITKNGSLPWQDKF